MRIGELSKLTGCPIGTIRFYEQKGVLPDIARNLGGQRSYSGKDVERLRFIMDCRTNGMKLECIERFLEYRDNPSLGNEWLLAQVKGYLQQVAKRREELDRVEKHLKAIALSLEKTLNRQALLTFLWSESFNGLHHFFNIVGDGYS